MSGAAEAGWYDDGTGKHRWWDGARWTEQYIDLNDPDLELHTDGSTSSPILRTRGAADAQEYGGIVVAGRWIHFGAQGVPVREVVALVATVGQISKRRALRDAVVNRMLFTPSGRISPGKFGKLDRRALYLAVEAPGRLWLCPVPSEGVAEADRFMSWVNMCAEHYRHRD